MRKAVLSFLLACCATLAFSQLNMTLTDQIDYTPQVSSLWGYIDPEDSTEYAAVGVSTGLSIVDLTDPYNVQEIAFIPDVNSQWREVKSWGHYIYAVTEGGGGMLVVNMTDPSNVTSTHWAPNIPGLGMLNKIHSITVDEFGYLYLNGSNLNSGGALIVDVSADNGIPVYVGKMPAIYSHDTYARNNFIYTSDIYEGNFKVYDIHDKSNPILLATQQTPYNFTHNTWLNDAGDVLFTTDEKANAPVTAYDISDLDNIVELDQFRPVATVGTGTIPHNVHVWNDWILTAYYTNGTIIVDGSRPENLIEVGNFDSFVTNPSGFYGVWGVYPYFPSGLVISSDMQNGLLVYEVNYVRACWLEGKVTDAITGDPIGGADVHIESSLPNAGKTDIQGNYKTGQATAGNYDVVVSATGYYSKTVPVTLENGVVTLLSVALEPLSIDTFPPFTYSAPTSGCAGLTVDFFENSGVGAAWAWTFEGGTPATSTEQNPSVEYDEAGTHSVTLQVTTAGGATYDLEAIDLVTIAPSPEADFSASVDTSSVTFTNNSSHYNTQQWNFGDGNTSFEANPTHQYHDAGTYTVVLTVFGDCGVASSTQEVTIVSPLPTAAFTADVVTGCSPLTVNFTDQSSSSPTAWAWTFEGGNPATSTDQKPTVTYDTPGSYDVTLSVTNATGNDEIVMEDFITVNESPVANFISIVNGPEVDFLNMPVFGGSYVYDFGDGSTATQSDPTHTYATPGTYTVALTVTNTCGTDTFSAEVTIEDFLPEAAFNASTTVGCGPLTVAFADQSEGQPISWTWAFPGGNPVTSFEQNPIVVYDTPGTFNVTLTVENAWGSASITQNDLITVNPAPTADFDFVVNGNDVSFTNHSINANTYEWVFNDGNGSTSTEANPTFTFPTSGLYSVVLNATNACGTVTYTAELAIGGVAPTAAFTISETSGCAPFVVEFGDQSAGTPTSWSWEFPGGNPSSSTEQNPTVTYDAAGIYSATLTVTNAYGESDTTETDAITVGIAPISAFYFTTNELETTFFNISENGSTYSWDFGDSTTSTAFSPVHSYADTGTYTVTLTVSNNCGSMTFTSEIVIIVDAPVPSFTANQTQGCTPFEVTFADQSAGMVTSWEWSFEGGTPATSTQQSPTVVFSAPGTYDVTLKVTGPGGTNTFLSEDIIIVNTIPVAAFSLTTDVAQTAEFINNSQGASSYIWDFGDSETSTDINPTHVYSEPGTYTVTLVAFNVCGSDTTSLEVELLDAVHEPSQFGYSLDAAPNPFGSQVWVSYELNSAGSKASILASDVLGRVVGQVPVQGMAGKLDLGDMFQNAGIYYLRMVVDGHAGKAMKVVKM